jgi:hypothetical protein
MLFLHSTLKGRETFFFFSGKNRAVRHDFDYIKIAICYILDNHFPHLAHVRVITSRIICEAPYCCGVERLIGCDRRGNLIVRGLFHAFFMCKFEAKKFY